MSDNFEAARGHLLAGNIDELKGAVQTLLDQGVSPQEVLDKGLMPAMHDLGERFSRAEVFLPDLLLAADTMQSGALDVLRPIIRASNEERESRGTAIIGTVMGDIHDLGKNLVKMMLEGATFNVIDLGTDVSGDQFAQAAQKEQADIVAMSALLTSTMAGMKDIIEAVRHTRPQAKFLLGGAPLSEEYAASIGADGYAADAYSAVKAAEGLMA